MSSIKILCAFPRTSSIAATHGVSKFKKAMSSSKKPPRTGPKASLDERVSARVSSIMKQELAAAAALRVPSTVRQRDDTIESGLRGIERKTTYATLQARALREVRKEMADEAKIEACIAVRRKEIALKSRPTAATPSASASKRANTVAVSPQLSTSKRSRTGAGKATATTDSEVGHY